MSPAGFGKIARKVVGRKSIKQTGETQVENDHERKAQRGRELARRCDRVIAFSRGSAAGNCVGSGFLARVRLCLWRSRGSWAGHFGTRFSQAMQMRICLPLAAVA
jgi:hypothetical protein